MKYDEFYNVNDYYKIKKDWDDIKKIIDEIEKDINKFLGPTRPKRRSVWARSKISKLKNKMLPVVAKKLLKTRQDFDVDFA